MSAPQNVVFDLLQRVLSFPAKHPNVNGYRQAYGLDYSEGLKTRQK